ncbi:MAG: triose-phosphate isomerase [Rickettsiaceae bacterium]|nr:triose-phosphate isomerase [Rickettsiaceae bacterium]
MKPIIIANWKMNLTLDEAYSKAKNLDSKSYSSQLLLAPPAPYLAYFAQNFKNTAICAQNVSALNGFGAYTGEYSAEMLKSCNVNYAILGHSERRNTLGETNKLIKKKAFNCIEAQITPIICVGETLEARKNKNYKEFIADQLNSSIPDNAESIIIAYEPFWAIGTGLVPTIEEIAEIFDFIKTSGDISIVAKNSQLVYGGSVSSKNHKDILSVTGNNGVILGSASLDENELNSILN